MIRLGHILSAGCLVAVGCMPAADSNDSNDNLGGAAAMVVNPNATVPGSSMSGTMTSNRMNGVADNSSSESDSNGMTTGNSGSVNSENESMSSMDEDIIFETPARLKQPFEGADPGNDPSCNSNTLNSVRGWIADENGQPLTGAKAQVCIKQGDMTQCLQPVDSTDDGTFELQLSDFRCVTEAAMRVILPRSGRTAMYCEIPMDKREGTRLTMPDPLLLFPTQPPSDLPDEGDGLTEKTVVFADGFELDLVPLNGPGYTDLGSTSIPGSTKGLCFLEGEKPPERLYGFSPDGGIYEGGSNFRIPNPDNLEVGTQVDLHVLGGLGCKDASGEALKEGEWHRMGTGTVVENGILPDDDAKLTCLTWLGITRRE